MRLVNIFYFLGGHPCPDGSGRYLGTFEYDGAGGNDGVTADNGIVHHDGAHTDQYIVFDRTAMHNRIVADRYIITDDGLGLLVSAMDHCAILYVYFIAHANAVHIAPHYRIEPETAAIASHHIAYDRGIGGDKRILSETGVFTIYV